MLTDTTAGLRSAPSLLSRSVGLSARPLLLALWLLGGCAQAPAYDERRDNADSQGMDDDRGPPTSSSRSDASREPADDEDDNDDAQGERPTSRPDAANPTRDATLPDVPVEAGASDAARPSEEPPEADASSGDDEMVDSAVPDDSPTRDAAAAPADTGASAPPDAEAAPAACMSTPSYLTPDACSRCLCAQCASQVAVCYASREQTKNQQCREVRACAQENQCVGADCYCGDSSRCLTQPTGPCVEVIQRAAGTTSTLEITSAMNDSSSPVGRSSALTTCGQSNCATECGL